MWCLKSLNATLWFLKTFLHLSKSCGFPNVLHIFGIGKLVVCNNRKKRGVVRTLTLMHSFGFGHGAGSASHLLLKPSNDTKPALRVTRAHHWQVRVFVDSLHDTPCVTCRVNVHAQLQ